MINPWSTTCYQATDKVFTHCPYMIHTWCMEYPQHQASQLINTLCMNDSYIVHAWSMHDPYTYTSMNHAWSMIGIYLINTWSIHDQCVLYDWSMTCSIHIHYMFHTTIHKLCSHDACVMTSWSMNGSCMIGTLFMNDPYHDPCMVHRWPICDP